MKTKKNIFFLVLMINLFIFSGFAQENSLKIDTIPKEIRTIHKNFKEKYLNNSEYDYTEKGPSLLVRIKQWILSKIIEFFNTTDADAVHIFRIIKITFYVIVLLGVIFILVKLYLNKEMRWIFKRKTDSDKTEFQSVSGDISEVNFKELIENATEKEDYRLAIRYYYLWILKKLDKASLIRYDVEKTNFDYQTELSGSLFSNDFKKASYYYSYIWYGEFVIGEREFEATSHVYNNLLKQIANV